MVAILMGLLLWTLLEYFLHRYAFHRFGTTLHSTHPKHHAPLSVCATPSSGWKLGAFDDHPSAADGELGPDN
jgi:hypothetical protein